MISSFSRATSSAANSSREPGTAALKLMAEKLASDPETFREAHALADAAMDGRAVHAQAPRSASSTSLAGAAPTRPDAGADRGGRVVGIGIDVEEVARVGELAARYGARFVGRIFTDGEAAYCLRRRSPAQHLAARFCAKEAAMKALGTGRAHGVLWRDVEVVRGGGGPPQLRLHGGARRRFEALGAAGALLTMTHSRQLAVAQVILVGG